MGWHLRLKALAVLKEAVPRVRAYHPATPGTFQQRLRRRGPRLGAFRYPQKGPEDFDSFFAGPARERRRAGAERRVVWASSERLGAAWRRAAYRRSASTHFAESEVCLLMG
jgi:hypothetical protein